jgi:hypothetical protein
LNFIEIAAILSSPWEKKTSTYSTFGALSSRTAAAQRWARYRRSRVFLSTIFPVQMNKPERAGKAFAFSTGQNSFLSILHLMQFRVEPVSP